MKKEIQKFTREWFVEQGKIGGAKTKDLYGRKHYSDIRRKKVDKSEEDEKTSTK